MNKDNKKAIILLALAVSLGGCVAGVLTATTAAVRSVAKDETIGQNIDDKVISANIAKDFFSAGLKEAYLKINVNVSKGRVMYVGKMDNEQQIMKAIEIAWNQEGVKKVINNLKLDPDQRGFDAGQYAKDTMITTQVVLKAISRPGVKSINYTVVTSDNVVYLFGIARSREELENISLIAAKVPGVAKVVAKDVKILSKP